MINVESCPLVSVLISSYNHASYVESAILSVLQQAYPRIELLVVDDGSVDDSVERIQKLQEKYGFDFIAQKNQGLSKTLNDMIARAKGSLIVPFGSDDMMLPDRLEKQVRFMYGKPEIGICAGNVECVDSDGVPLVKQQMSPARRLGFEDVFLNLKPGAPAATLMFRREALEAVGGFDPAIRLEDVYIELMITRCGYFIEVMEDVLAQYRIHATNTYKNYSFMVDSMLATLSRFADHPRYQDARNLYLNSMFLKVARRDAKLGRRLLRLIPFSAWTSKTVRGIYRLMTA